MNWSPCTRTSSAELGWSFGGKSVRSTSDSSTSVGDRPEVGRVRARVRGGNAGQYCGVVRLGGAALENDSKGAPTSPEGDPMKAGVMRSVVPPRPFGDRRGSVVQSQ